MVTVGQTPSRNAKLPKTVYMIRVMILIMQNSLYTTTTWAHIYTYFVQLSSLSSLWCHSCCYYIYNLSPLLNGVPRKTHSNVDLFYPSMQEMSIVLLYIKVSIHIRGPRKVIKRFLKPCYTACNKINHFVHITVCQKIRIR